MDNALVSVIIPVYNVSEYVERCVNSLLAQTYQNIEVILINDGSTDNSGKVCRNLRDKHPEKIIFIEQENSGVSAARNAGLDVARGEYIVFVDADDWVSVDYVEKLYSALIENNADMSACGFVEWYNEEKKHDRRSINAGVYDLSTLYKIIGLNQIYMWTGMYKMSIVQRYHIRFDTLLRRMEDGCFVAQYTCHCNQVAFIEDNLYYYYQRDTSVMHEYRPQTLLGVERDAYITSILENAYNSSNVSREIYKHHFVKRWSRFIVREAIAITYKEHPTSRKEKKEFLKKSIEISKIKERLENIKNEKRTFSQRIFTRWTLKEHIGCFLIYGYVYNALRTIKHKIKGS